MRDFLNSLAAAGELLVVDREVDPRFELAAMTRRFQDTTDHGVVFTRVRGTKIPVATNLYTTRRRLNQLLGAPADGFCARWIQLLDEAGRWRQAATAQERRPEDLITGALHELPAITYHAKDGGPYFTSAIYLARDPQTGVPNLSFHRSMIINDGELRVRLGTTHDLAKYQRQAEEQGRPLEAALLIGVGPEIFLAAAASLPTDWDELALAAAVRGSPVPTYAARTVDLEIPASAQCVIEGRFLPKERRTEGPFGEFLGYYVPAGDNHVFEITDCYWRSDAIAHSILCGSREDLCVLEAVYGAKTYRHLKDRVPGIIDVSCAPAFMNTTIKMRPQYEGHARQAILAAFSADLDYNRAVFAVDEDVDITDMNEVMWAFLTRGRVDTRTMVLHDIPGFYRDPHKDFWGRIGIDATKPFGREAEFERKTVPGVDGVDMTSGVRRADPDLVARLRCGE